MRTKEQLIEIYGESNVREFKGRLQVLETHFQNPGGRVDEWVEETNALPPVEVSDPVILDDPVPEEKTKKGLFRKK